MFYHLSVAVLIQRSVPYNTIVRLDELFAIILSCEGTKDLTLD